ncbi:MAG: magnesium transporter [Bacteroidetes bacterium]|nr:magnesium transporter [Bacteroidota bacterium]MDA1120651.1 magnesium transporter [Bacteroidota bacterium]
MNDTPAFELTKEFHELFNQAIETKDVEFIRDSLEGADHADISSLLNEFNPEQSKYVLDLLDTSVGANIIIEMDEDSRGKFLDEFDSAEIAGYVDQLETDDGADILYGLPVKEREQVISAMLNEEKARNIVELLHYDEDVAGGLMAKELIKANLNWTIKQCIEEIRKQAEHVENIYSVYVVNNNDKLLGKVSLKKLIISSDLTKVGDIYDSDIHSVETFTPEDEVAAIMRKYDLDVIPVVNLKGQLMGRITNDDIIDVITELAEEERQLMAGIATDVEEDDSIWKLSRARLPWLMIGLVGGSIAAYFIGFFESEIILIPAMSFFIPLIMATGGNVGIQSSSIIVQSLASRNAFEESMWNRLFKSLLVSIVNGAVLSIAVYFIVFSFDSDSTIAMVVAIALFSVVLLASFMGTITPLILNKFDINPALASGPFITTANDLLGLLVYFGVASALYQF